MQEHNANSHNSDNQGSMFHDGCSGKNIEPVNTYSMTSPSLHKDRDTQRGIQEAKPHGFIRCKSAPVATRMPIRNDYDILDEKRMKYRHLPTKNFDRMSPDTTMTGTDAREFYGYKNLCLEDKRKDRHRSRWETGEWTDDSDQMILFMQSLIENGGKMQEHNAKSHNSDNQGSMLHAGCGGKNIKPVDTYSMTSPSLHKDRDTQRGIQEAKPHGFIRCTSAPVATRMPIRNDCDIIDERRMKYRYLPTKNFDRMSPDMTMPVHRSSKHLSEWEVEELNWQQQQRERYDHKVAASIYGRKIRALDTRYREDGIREKIIATIYGNCVGDAIGLLTEFMTGKEAREFYGYKDLCLEDKRNDSHRSRWKTGEWTDDSDQMILIMQSLIENGGKVNVKDFAEKLKDWADVGFPEIRDTFGGLGIGRTTYSIIQQRDFLHNPHKAAEEVWLQSGKTIAPNGGIMRTSILGIHEWWDLDKVERNTIQICMTTHHDPRCQASAVAVSTAIALMLQGEHSVPTIISKCYERASKLLKDKYHKYELYKALHCENLYELRLDEDGKIGYTFKCLGAGFWALNQNNFQKALTEIVLNGGDADTNGAVAGALLGCKLGTEDKIHQPWLLGLKNKSWLDKQIYQYLAILTDMQQARRY